MRRTVRNGLIDYLIADDDAQPYDARWWAVLRTRAVDELTGEPPLGRIAISTTTPGFLPRVGDSGLCGLVARPGAVSGPMLTPGGLTAEIRVDGYLPRSLTTAIDSARRTINGTTLAGTNQLNNITPPEPPSRPQFHPGRGVLIQRVSANQADEFTLHADPVIPPGPGQVPLVDPVRSTHALGTRVAGVPITLPDQPLHRAEPAVVRGRALRQPALNALPIAAPAAQIGLTGVWWFNAEIPANSSPPHPADLVSFAAPLAFDHAPGTTLERRTAVGAPDAVTRALALPAAAGAGEIELDDITGLQTGGNDALELEAANSAERELVITAGYVAPTNTTRARVRLATPLAFAHAAGTLVRRVQPAFTAPAAALAREAQQGDRVLFASTLANVQTDDVLRIAGGTPSAELRFVRRYPTYDSGTSTFDHGVTLAPDGTFALPPIARVAQIQLFVKHAAQHAHDPVDLVPDYRSESTPLQILFKP